MAAKVIAIINNKGGVGKSTITTNLGDCLGRIGNRGLVIDLDPQANSSAVLSAVNPERLATTVGHLMLSNDPLALIPQCLIENTGFKRLHLLPANLSLDLQAEEMHMRMHLASLRLQRVIAEVRDLYDYILIDCPPRLSGVLPANALACADHVIIPVESGDEFSLAGLDNVLSYITRTKSELNPSLGTPLCLINMVTRRTLAARHTESALRKRQSERGDIVLLESSIPESAQAKNALLAKQSILAFRDNTAIAESLRELADEINQRIGGKPPARTQSRRGVAQ